MTSSQLIIDRLLRLRLNNNSSPLNDPTSYRSISIFPDVTELTRRASKYTLPRNITNGPYESLHDYLKTHFMLLREDFIKPIREDLCAFLAGSSNKLMNIKIHEVQFIRKGVKNNDVCHCIEIKRGVTYQYWNIKTDSKRFMLGSLVIFSKDNFKTIVCGRVADNRSLLYRKLLISFEEFVKVQYNQTYAMIECNQFFEPYYQVLKVIQQIDTKSFPLTQHLIQADPSVGMPTYLNGTKLVVSDPELNPSQKVALDAALQQKLVIIQGPPGTGKTFLGLKIAKQLLTISRLWWDESPMLVISFTNHALDQFLEGLTEATDRIMRLGGQSRNPKMKNYTVGECRQRFYSSSTERLQKRYQMGQLYKEYRYMERKVLDMGNQMDNIFTTKPTCIFYFDVLARGVPEVDRLFPNASHEEMVTWLMEEDGTIICEENPQLTAAEDRRTMSEVYNKFLKDSHKGSKYCLFSVSIMSVAVHKLYDKIVERSQGIELMKQKHQENVGLTARIYIESKIQDLRKLIYYYNYLLHKINYLKYCLRTRFTKPSDRSCISSNQTDPFRIPVRMRWYFYQNWICKYETFLTQKMEELILEYKPVYAKFNRLQEKISEDLIKHQKIIGMTTTMAARMHSVLKRVQCPIVIVEEAAEVLEAHIIPVLTEHCKHLILIGDHKQLRPTTADYEIETKYHLGVSMFERMVRNDIQCYTLNVQHRMRPEVSSLVTPSIYPVLHNHESVTKFPEIRGMQKCLYFITHREPEQSSGNSSKKNLHEATFLIQLASHLLRNGYKPEEITILAAYLGQVGALMQEQSKANHPNVKDVKITSVDNFQGEENKIILLSLVRNNDHKNIGFLSIENRVCVALSRAKEGMYIIGNIELLKYCSPLWRKIYVTLTGQNSVGFGLPLQCERHGTITRVRSPADFELLAANGGCMNACNSELPCGHKCTQLCHFDDHAEYKCLAPCSKSSCKNPRHRCLKLCYEPCCMCTEKLPQTLSCGHHVLCFMDQMEDFRCLEKVYVRLSCGHKTAIQCSENDSDFEDELQCSICKVSPAKEVKNTSKDSALGEVELLGEGLRHLNISGVQGKLDWDVKLPTAPELLGIIVDKEQRGVVQGISEKEVLNKYVGDLSEFEENPLIKQLEESEEEEEQEEVIE